MKLAYVSLEAIKIFWEELIVYFPLIQRFTQPLTEMSTRNKKIMFLGSKVRRADNLTTSELIV
jgi:hypothetical protein